MDIMEIKQIQNCADFFNFWSEKSKPVLKWNRLWKMLPNIFYYFVNPLLLKGAVNGQSRQGTFKLSLSL